MSSTGNSAVGRLLVRESDDEDSSEPAHCDQIFTIEKKLQTTGKAEYDRVYRIISNADVDLGTSLPVYEVAWKHLLKNRRGHLHGLVLCYRRLAETVEATNPDEIVCADGMERRYRAVVEDIGAEYGIPVDVRTPPERLVRFKRFLVSSLLVCPFLLDQVLSLVLKRVTRRPSEVPVVFVPALGRLDSMTPVMEEASFGFETVIASMASSWLWRVRYAGLDEFDPIPISQFSSLRCVYRQLSAHLTIARKALLGDDLKRELAALSNNELDVELDRALTYTIQQGFKTRMFTSLFLYYLIDKLIEDVGCEKLVIGGLSPAGKAMVAKAIDEEIDVYHIPHGIGAASDCPNPPPELVQFVSGKLEKRHYEESPQVQQPWNCIPTGRPYLTELYESYADRTASGTDGPLRILLATSPIDPRMEFVSEVARAADQTGINAELTIKIHPSEEPETYASLARQYPFVTVAETGLHERLHKADLTLTINSNVGVESVVVGTPCLSVNWWDPIVPVPMYAQYGGVPVLDSPDRIHEFFRDVTGETLADLLTTESKFVHDSYELRTDATAEIAARLRP